MNNVRVRLPRKLAKSVSSGVLAEAGRLNPVGALNITLNMLPLHRVTMTLAENDLPLAMHDLVEVYNHKGSVGIYRVTKIPHTIGKNRKYELSHGLDVLSDATFDMIEEYKGTVDGMLAKIINAQTQMIGGVKYWRLGVCEDTNPWNKDIKYDNLMECLTEIAKKEEDYMFTFDQSTFPWTLNFVARDSAVLSEFRLNRNTENCLITEDDTGLCTRLYLSVTSETNDDEGHGTYINEGYFTYNDTDAQNAGFGVVCKTAGVNQEDFTSQAALEAWVAAYFGRHNRPGVQITIDGVELNKITGESIDEVHLSRICRVALPEYSCTFNERIVSVNYPDALRKPTYVRNSLANKRQTAEDAFSEIKNTTTSTSKSASGAGRSAHNDATYFRRTIGDTANGLYSRIEQTAYYIRSEVVDTANGLYSKIEQTASYIRSEVANTANGLNSKIEQTASYIRSEVANTANGLNSKIEQTASYIRSEVSNTANGLYSKIEETASYIRTEVANTANGLRSSITEQANRISLVVEGTGSNAHVRPASITAAITDSNGKLTSSITVDADNVYIGNTKSTTVISGKCALSDVTADYIANKIATIGTLNGIAASFSGNISTSSGVIAYQVYADGHNISNPVMDVQISGPTNNVYTLQKKAASDASWQDAGTFSRAVASWTMGWSNGTFEATANPQNQSCSTTLVQGNATWDGNVATVPINAHDSDNPSYDYATGRSVLVDASSIYAKAVPDSGTASARHGSGWNWDFVITKHDGTTKTLTIDVSDIVVAARVGYTLGTFTLADVTLQGDSDAVYKEVSSGGVNYYEADSAANYYQSGRTYTYYTAGSGTKYDRGDSVTAREVLSDGGTIYYRPGSKITRYKKGSTYTYYAAGSTVTRYTRSNGIRLKHDGTARHYDVNGNLIGNHDWYHIVTTGETMYYETTSANVTKQGQEVSVTVLGDSEEITPIGSTSVRLDSSKTYYKGNGGSFTPQGTAVEITARGDSVSVTPIKTSSRKMLASTTRYKAGTRYQSTYYTKS